MKLIFILLCFIALVAKSFAQTGTCGSGGTYVNYDDYINYNRSSGGDLEVGTLGFVQVGASGNFDLYGAVINNGKIQIDSGGIFSIYGNMLNNGVIIIHKNATVHFYGNTWKNNPTAIVSDGDTLTNTIPGGILNFTANRPNVPASWVSLSACLTSYSGGNSSQYTDGGNVPMDVALHLKNANNILLINSPTRIEGKLHWDVPNGDIELGNQDLIFTQNAAQDGYQPDRFAITNGLGHLVKENYTGNWIFPIGITDGDYTPASIDNGTANTMHVLVQNYATSAADEAISGASADGMDRTWNIYAAIASGTSLLNFQHNSITNQPAFNDAYNFVTRWGTTVPNPTGDYSIGFGMSAWQSNFAASGTIGNLSSIGTVPGSNMRSRTYYDFATSPSDAKAYFSKSSDPLHPLPVQLLSFSAESQACAVLIKFSTGTESSISKFQIQRSTNGIEYTSIANIDPKGTNSNYSFIDKNPVQGKNLYRLLMIETNGDYTRSPVVITDINCDIQKPNINLYPNPAINFITLSGMKSASEIRITNIHGRIVIALSSTASSEMIDVSQLAAATYVVQVIMGKTAISNLQFTKL